MLQEFQIKKMGHVLSDEDMDQFYDFFRGYLQDQDKLIKQF